MHSDYLRFRKYSKQGILLLGCLVFMLLCSILLAVHVLALGENEAQVSQSYVAAEDVAESRPQDSSLDTEVAFAQHMAVDELIVYLKEVSITRGAADAYEILRRLPSKFDNYKHLLGHVIGNELYAQQNIQGLKLCTTEFTSACYHSILSWAIAEQGMENIEAINSKCLELKEPWGCQHGLGHGIVVALGYEEPITAVEVCESLEEYGLTYSCIEGVIMEFNLRTVDEDIAKVRGVDQRGYYYPCTEIGSKYKNECIFEQTLWWRELFGRTNYEAIGTLCAGIQEEGNRVWCYRGIGRLIPEFSTDTVEVMAAECITATPDVQGQSACLQMLNIRTGGEDEDTICKLADVAYENICRSPVPEIRE